MSSFMAWFMILLLSFVSFLLIVVVLLQRGRGGGLAGAFGGAGGQSAFGTKAGDVFTRITVVMAIVWVMLSGFTGWAMQNSTNLYPGGNKVQDEINSTDDGSEESDGAGASQTPPELPTGKPVDDSDADDTDSSTESIDTDSDNSDDAEESETSTSSESKPDSDSKPEDDGEKKDE